MCAISLSRSTSPTLAAGGSDEDNMNTGGTSSDSDSDSDSSVDSVENLKGELKAAKQHLGSPSAKARSMAVSRIKELEGQLKAKLAERATQADDMDERAN